MNKTQNKIDYNNKERYKLKWTDHQQLHEILNPIEFYDIKINYSKGNSTKLTNEFFNISGWK